MTFPRKRTMPFLGIANITTLRRRARPIRRPRHRDVRSQTRTLAAPGARCHSHDTGAEVVPDHVGDPDQVVEHLAPFGLRQVQRHALLVPVDGKEVCALPIGEEWRPHHPHRVAAVRLLDLDHLGPQVRYEHGAVRPRQHPSEVQHPHPGEERHSITLSAQIRIDCGIVRPSAFAVFRFTTSSNFVGCSTGRSPGFAPLRILST